MAAARPATPLRQSALAEQAAHEARQRKAAAAEARRQAERPPAPPSWPASAPGPSREVETFADDCRRRAEAARGGTDKPNTQHHACAARLAAAAQAWAAEQAPPPLPIQH